MLQKENTVELILTGLIVIYIVLGYKTPDTLARLLDTIVGKIVLFLIVIYLFMYSNPILAIISLFAAFYLLYESNLSMNKRAMQRFMPSEQHKSSQFSAFNQFPYTLEQEMVKKMAPIIRTGSVLNPASYKPKLDNTYDAAKV